MRKVVNLWRYTLNERLRILKLLEEGKINAEEAARLLEALSESQARHKKHHRMWAPFEHISEHIATIINGSVEHMASPEVLRFKDKHELEIKAISGDLVINGTNHNEILVNKQGFGRIKGKNDKVEIKAISGDVHIHAPRYIKLMIKGVSGAVTISEIENNIILKTVSGNITGKNLKGSFTGNIIAGDISLDYVEVNNLDIHSLSGDVTIYLNDQTDARVHIETEEGTISSNLPLKDEQKSEFSLKGTMNTGKNTINIRCDYGDTVLKKRETKETINK
jgi:DUF4097 and DUF4098 domain-containing protein YvlB